jgi:hypothetical protein
MAKQAAAQLHPMRNIAESWLAKIDLAIRVRDEEFGQYAKEAEMFFDGAHNFMWDQRYRQGPGGFLDQDGMLPTFRIQVNKLFDAVALFGPSLYSQNPNALVEPILPPEVPPEALGIDPNDPYGMQQYMLLAQEEGMKLAQRKACASVKTSYLNWLQTETDKKTESRLSITEALIAGIGYVETTIHQPDGSNVKFPRSRYVSWYDVVVDPDANYWEDVQWVAIRRCQPVNKAERRFGYESGGLKGHHQSFAAQTTKRGKKEARQNRDAKSFDTIEYWEVYSKNGFGDLLEDKAEIPKLHSLDYSPLGDYCYIVVSRGIGHPLNVPADALAEGAAEELQARVQWPVPFWFDDGGWPISRLGFYEKPHSVWPISIFKPVIGELRFVNWCLSFVADKVAANCQTYIGVIKAAVEDFKTQVANKTGPYTMIEISQVLDKPLDQIVSFLQAPNFSVDIWRMIAEVMELIDKRTGLTELMYASGTQSRTATDAQNKQSNLAIRPDDMASRVEDWLTEIEIREMQAARWFCEPQDVEPCVGTMGALIWQNYVMTDDVDQVVRGFNYRIEAGSARKPNKASKAQQLIELGQYMLPVLQEMATAGNVAPWNAYISDMAKNMDLDPSAYLLQPPPQEQGPSPEQQEMEMKMAELELKLTGMQQELGMESAKFNQEMEHDDRRMEMEEESHDAELQRDKEKAASDVKVAQAKAKAAKTKPKSGAKK